MSVAFEGTFPSRSRLAEAGMALAVALVAGLVWGVLLPFQVMTALT